MPTGLDHVLAAIALCQRLIRGMSALQGVEDAPKQSLTLRLEKVHCDLMMMQDRFFLRSKLCLPFAARCEQEARKLEGALGNLGASGGPESLHSFGGTLEALERAVKVLDDRSAAQGMVIT